MVEKTVNINNFIGTYDNYITEQECNKAIQLFGNPVSEIIVNNKRESMKLRKYKAGFFSISHQNILTGFALGNVEFPQTENHIWNDPFWHSTFVEIVHPLQTILHQELK